MVLGTAAATAGSSALIALHGKSHFYLTTGIQPTTLLPKPPPPPQARRKMGETPSMARERRKQEAAAKAERDAQLVSAILQRAKTEGPPLVWPEGSAPDAAPAAAPSAGAPAAEVPPWTPWRNTPRDMSDRADVEATLEALMADTNRLSETVQYVQSKSYRLQEALGPPRKHPMDGAAGHAGGDHAEAHDPHWLRSGGGSAQNLPQTPARSGGHSGVLAPPSVALLPPSRASYLYPRADGHAAGADFVASPAERPASAHPARLPPSASPAEIPSAAAAAARPQSAAAFASDYSREYMSALKESG